MSNLTKSIASGTWTYRSLLNDPDLSQDFDKLEFGRANLQIQTYENGSLRGRIYGTDWELELNGSFQNGTPATLWFRGKGIVNDSAWIYDYLCYVVPHIPEGVNQVPALVGSITRAIPHPDGNGGISPAGVVASFYAVLQNEV